MEKAIQDRIAALPSEPGVYLMKDRSGQVVYVGKAVNLRERVRSYFSGADQRAFVPALEGLLGDIETIVVKNEKEALLLENELIRRHKPRFNARPKEGKNFIYLRLDAKQRYPRLEVTRQVQRDGARYFGPYPLARALRETLRIVNRYFKLRTCSDHDARSHERPCLLCQIARFPAPSVYDIPEEEYRRHVEGAIMFLEGERTDLVRDLRARMAVATAALRFEEAARLRDQLAAIERTLEPQEIIAATRIDQDAIGHCRRGDRLQLYMLHVRHGRIIGGQAFPFSGQEFPDRELLGSFVNQYYGRNVFVPDEVLLPIDIDAPEVLADLLAERKGAKVRVLVPQRGWRQKLIELARRNAEQGLRPRLAAQTEPANVLERLRKRLGLGRIPRRMECFDVSHFHGGAIVAAQVAMTDGQPDKDRYRRYRVTTVTVGDDYAAMHEVLTRRLRRGLANGDLPDLIVVDGGKPQLGAAQAALKDVGIAGVDAVALAKSRELPETAAPYGLRAEVPERIYVPGRPEPVVLAQDSPELLLLARLRDEAHRFAITYQRKLMRRERLRSELEDIPGIGTERRRALLHHFGSVRRVYDASVEELAEVENVGLALARRIHEHLHVA
jgi:excinuclease ABC subunit C